MKILFVVLLISTSSFSQKMPEDYFEEATEFFEEENYDEALKSYQYIVDNHPKNELYPRAFYNVGTIYLLQKNYKAAILVFEAILKSSFNETEALGGDITGDPFANYKHRASEMLSTIYFDQGNYKKALEYFELSDIKYPYLHFCGNEIYSSRINTALRYAAIYSKLNQPENAIEKLLPFVFAQYPYNNRVIGNLQKLLSKKKNVKKEFDKTLEEAYLKSNDTISSSYKEYYLKFMNVEIQLPFTEDDEMITNKEALINAIKASAFYQMIETLE